MAPGEPELPRRPAAPRVDFAVPESARRDRCRYCLATIYWAPEVHRGPLHAATAVRRDGETRMESHVAHCPKRERALAAAKTTACPVRGCDERIENGTAAPILCPRCWARLPEEIRSWIASEAALRPRRKAFLEAVEHGRKIAAHRLEAERGRAPTPPATQPVLFPGAEWD